jgi:hypothetical protein
MSETGNLITLCENIARHAGALIVDGAASNPTFKRRMHSP